MSSDEPARVSRRPHGRAGWPRSARAAWLGAATAALAAALGAGCAKPPPPPPVTEITGVLQASATVNPSVRGRASPLVVRVYELKSATAFNAADFVSLYQRDQAELGAEMVGRDEFILAPGDSREFVKRASPETRFLGVLGGFRNLEYARWRSAVPIQPGQKQRVVIRAEELSITATVSR